MDIKSPQEATKLCTSCHIFYRTAASQWLCSDCKKNKRKQAELAKTTIATKVKVVYPQIQTTKQNPSIRIQQKDKGRCFKCNKKVGLLGIQCKCDYMFCNQNRLPEAHECRIDYKKIGQQKLAKDNKIVAPPKISEI